MSVVPASAGMTGWGSRGLGWFFSWIPACAGMTGWGGVTVFRRSRPRLSLSPRSCGGEPSGTGCSGNPCGRPSAKTFGGRPVSVSGDLLPPGLDFSPRFAWTGNVPGRPATRRGAMAAPERPRRGKGKATTGCIARSPTWTALAAPEHPRRGRGNVPLRSRHPCASLGWPQPFRGPQGRSCDATGRWRAGTVTRRCDSHGISPQASA